MTSECRTMVSPLACQARYTSSILATRSSAVSVGLQTLINQKTSQVIGYLPPDIWSASWCKPSNRSICNRPTRDYSEWASTSLQEENAMDEIFLVHLGREHKVHWTTKNKTRAHGAAANMPHCQCGERGFDSLWARHNMERWPSLVYGTSLEN